MRSWRGNGRGHIACRKDGRWGQRCWNGDPAEKISVRKHQPDGLMTFRESREAVGGAERRRFEILTSGRCYMSSSRRQSTYKQSLE